MDFTTLIPIELSRHIFGFLPAKSLAVCWSVSKGWREIASDNFLWKNICDKEKITEDYLDNIDVANDGSIGILEPLSKHAHLYQTVHNTIFQNWKNDKYFKFELESQVEHVEIDNSCLFKSFMNGIITVSKLKNKTFIKSQVIKSLVPGERTTFLHAEHNCLAISCNNIVILYVANSDQYYNIHTAIAIQNDNAYVSSTGIETFITKYYSDENIVNCVALFPKFLWIYDNCKLVVIYDWHKGCLVKQYPVETNCKFESNGIDKVYTCSVSDVSVYLMNGCVKLRYIPDSSLNCTRKVCFNSDFVCLSEFSKLKSTGQLVTINVKTNRYEYLNVPSLFFFEVHPRLNIVYCLSDAHLNAYCLHTSKLIWTVPLKGSPCSFSFRLNFVLDYVVINPFNNSRLWVAMYNAKTGQFSYRSFLGGPPILVSDMYLVSRTSFHSRGQLKFIVRTYF